jgi:hypothetical protein
VTPSSVASTPGPENFSPYPSSEIESPAPSISPLASRTTIARTSTPRGTPSKPVETADGDDKLKNFFQSLLVNKGK